MKIVLHFAVYIGLLASGGAGVFAATAPVGAEQPMSTLFRNVQIFDGRHNRLTRGHVLVVGEKIERISKQDIALPKGATLVEGEGRVLMPGMIDAHVHITDGMMSNNSAPSYVALRAAESVKAMLMRGFTTVRDVGGADGGYSKAIDEGLIVGPRVLYAGRVISQTSGHGDFRPASAGYLAPSPGIKNIGGGAVVADGVDQVTLATRTELRKGAQLIKIMAGGGISSDHDPIDVVQYTEAEIRAAVQASENWGTYVTAHAYTPKAIQNAINAGVKSIEHGHLMDNKTAKIMAKKGIYLVPHLLMERERVPSYYHHLLPKLDKVSVAQDNMMRLIKKYQIKTGFGTDLLHKDTQKLQSKRIVDRLKWFNEFEILQQLTSFGGEIIALSGPRNPYGKVGVIEEGAMADLLLLEGNPLEDIKVLGSPQQNLLVIMKGGEVYKNTL